MRSRGDLHGAIIAGTEKLSTRRQAAPSLELLALTATNESNGSLLRQEARRDEPGRLDGVCSARARRSLSAEAGASRDADETPPPRPQQAPSGDVGDSSVSRIATLRPSRS